MYALVEERNVDPEIVADRYDLDVADELKSPTKEFDMVDALKYEANHEENTLEGETRAPSSADGTVDSHGLYRGHVPDLIRSSEDLWVTIQQIGANHKEGYFDRSDDIASGY